MKVAFIILLTVALCSHVCVVTCATSSTTPLAGLLPSSITTTTAKPWTEKFKNGLGKFFQGAAVVGAVSQGIQNARSHKHNKHTPSLPAAKTVS